MDHNDDARLGASRNIKRFSLTRTAIEATTDYASDLRDPTKNTTRGIY